MPNFVSIPLGPLSTLPFKFLMFIFNLVTTFLTPNSSTSFSPFLTLMIPLSVVTLPDSSSPSPHLPPAAFLDAWAKVKSHLKVFDPPHESHTFFHVSAGVPSSHSWSS